MLVSLPFRNYYIHLQNREKAFQPPLNKWQLARWKTSILLWFINANLKAMRLNPDRELMFKRDLHATFVGPIWY